MSHKMGLSEKEWAYALLNIAEIIASSNASVRMINKIYDMDPLFILSKRSDVTLLFL